MLYSMPINPLNLKCQPPENIKFVQKIHRIILKNSVDFVARFT